MIREEIRKFIVDKFLFGIDNNLDYDISLISNNILDSVGILEIVSFIENTYKIKVEDEELTAENLDSINKIARFIERKLGTQG